MKELVEKLIGRLEEKQKIETSFKRDNFSAGVLHGYRDAISTINQLAEEYNNCSTNISTDKSTTNADRIRSMSDEELAKFIRAVECCSRYSADCGFPFCPSMEGNLCNGIKEKTEQYILDWLQSEVKGSGI